MNPSMLKSDSRLAKSILACLCAAALAGCVTQTEGPQLPDSSAAAKGSGGSAESGGSGAPAPSAASAASSARGGAQAAVSPSGGGTKLPLAGASARQARPAAGVGANSAAPTGAPSGTPSAVLETRLAVIVVRDRAVTLRGHAQWDADCKSLDPPLVTLVEPPSHGHIDLREGEVVPSGNWFGKTPCNGMRMRGVLVSFVPAKGYRGVDRVRYVVDYGNGTKPQPVRVDIGVR